MAKERKEAEEKEAEAAERELAEQAERDREAAVTASAEHLQPRDDDVAAETGSSLNEDLHIAGKEAPQPAVDGVIPAEKPSPPPPPSSETDAGREAAEKDEKLKREVGTAYDESQQAGPGPGPSHGDPNDGRTLTDDQVRER